LLLAVEALLWRASGVMMAELQRDWAREATVAGIAAVLGQHGGGSAVAFAWETGMSF
jgi:hypothetical protein